MTSHVSSPQDSGLSTQHFEPVAVTGLGIVSPIGVGHAQFWRALCAGESGVQALPGATSIPHVAVRVVEFSPREFIRSAHLRRMDALSRTLVSAGRMALADARLDARAFDPTRLGVVVGSAIGNISESVQYLERLFTKGPGLASPMMFPNLVLNAPASYAAMEIGCTGANLTVSQGETSGEQAIALGCDLIRAGRADVVLAGGGDELAEIVVAAYRNFSALSGQRGGAEWCSPYDVERNGIVLGEGAALLVLESTAHARQRAVPVYAEIEDYLSFGVGSPLYDWPPHAPRAATRLQTLLRSTTAPGPSLDLVCGSANSSRRLDACELEILTALCGARAPEVTLTSIKGAIGEFGAAGALTAVATCLALHHGIVPPLCHLRQAPADVTFQLAAHTGQAQPLRRAMQLSIGRGGSVLALLFRRPIE